MPQPDDLPANLRAFAFHNAIRIRPDPDFETDADRLIAGISPEQGPGKRIATEIEDAARRRANLSFDLPATGIPGINRLLARNSGESPAKNVVVEGMQSMQTWGTLARFTNIPSQSEARIDFHHSGWMLIGGVGLELRVTWTDGNGEHTDAFQATYLF